MSAMQLARRRRRALLARRTQSSQSSQPKSTAASCILNETGTKESIQTPTVAASTSTLKPKRTNSPRAGVAGTPFVTDLSDDSEDDHGGERSNSRTSKKRPRRVTSVSVVVTEAETTSAKQARQMATKDERSTSNDEKPSQIAQMLRKRKEHGVTAERNDDKLFLELLSRCADDASTETYRATPVIGFGEAMLRSMGWNGEEEEEDGRDKKGETDDELKPRPERLGLGAKLSMEGRPPLPKAKKQRHNGQGAIPSEEDSRGNAQPSAANSKSDEQDVDGGVVATS